MIFDEQILLFTSCGGGMNAGHVKRQLKFAPFSFFRRYLRHSVAMRSDSRIIRSITKFLSAT